MTSAVNTEASYDSEKAWIASLPDNVQRLIGAFPLNSVFMIEGEKYYLLGYTEDELVIVTPVSPANDYDAAVEKRRFIRPEHLKRGSQ